MPFIAKARYIRISPYKLRPLVDVIRGKSAEYAINWLTAHSIKRSLPIMKVLKSAIANSKISKRNQLIIKDIRVDQGPIIRYFKPGAMGRSNPYRKRLSHISVVLEPVNKGGVA